MTHEHKFTIPVEWTYMTPIYDGSGHDVPAREPEWHEVDVSVTKLRCECGEETNR